MMYSCHFVDVETGYFVKSRFRIAVGKRRRILRSFHRDWRDATCIWIIEWREWRSSSSRCVRTLRFCLKWVIKKRINGCRLRVVRKQRRMTRWVWNYLSLISWLMKLIRRNFVFVSYFWMSSLETCVICNKENACVQCCNLYFCLLDFLTSLHSAHFENARIINTEQFNLDLPMCEQVL